MVSQTLYPINLWLTEIIGVNKPFGQLSVISCGDFYQFPPVNPSAI